jgi:hypothetical protein
VEPVFTQYFHPMSTNMVHNPPWKVHHSMQNLILHRSQPLRAPSQVQRRMSARITVWNRFSPSIFTQRPQIWSTTPLGKDTSRCRIKFCIHHNHLETHHKSIGECQQEKLESADNFYYVYSYYNTTRKILK